MSRSLRRVLRRAPLVAALVLLGLLSSQLVHAAPPTNESFGFDPGNPVVGQNVTFTANAPTDPDPGDTFTYQWDFDYGGSGTFVPEVSGPENQVTRAAPNDPTWSVALRVVDASGEQSPVVDRVVPVSQPANQPPTNNTISGPTSAGVREAITLTANATDPDDSLSYSWNLDGGSITSGGGASVGVLWTTGGTKNVTVTVTENRPGGVSSTSPVHQVVVTNAAPSAGTIFLDPPTPAVNQAITFSSNSSDPNGDPLTYDWDFGDGGSSTASSPTHSYSTPGNKTVTLTVSDPSGAVSPPATRTFMVQLSVPNGSFSTSPGAPLPGQAVTFTSTSSPSAGKSITGVEWDFDYARSTDTFTVDATGTSVSHAFPSAGAKSVAMRVSEGPDGGFDIVPGTVTVNAPPQAAFALSSASAFVGDAVTASSTSSDPDGPIARQDWDLDNDGQFDDANSAVVSARFRRAGTYTLGLRVTDSQGATATTTGSVRVRRRPLAVIPDVVIDLEGNVLGVYTRVSRLVVSAPRRTKVTVRCIGRRVGNGCPRKTAKRVKGRKALRFKSFERRFRPSMKIVIIASRKGYISKHTTFLIRRGIGPQRRTQCLTPGAKRPKKCPRR